MESIKEENIIKHTCQELGITQKELAQRTGLSVSAISKWNQGAKIPNSAEKTFNLLVENFKLNKLVLKLM